MPQDKITGKLTAFNTVSDFYTNQAYDENKNLTNIYCPLSDAARCQCGHISQHLTFGLSRRSSAYSLARIHVYMCL